MSDWLEATREVYSAGGQIMTRKMYQPLAAITRARERGLLEPGKVGGREFAVRITQRGIDLIEGRLTLRVPYVPRQGAGRAPGTHRRLVATWLMALPRTNEVRL